MEMQNIKLLSTENNTITQISCCNENYLRCAIFLINEVLPILIALEICIVEVNGPSSSVADLKYIHSVSSDELESFFLIRKE